MPDDVFEGGGLMRRIIAVFNDVVIYSNGGNTTRHCKMQTLKRWRRRHKATLEYRAK